jgi:hypothetical protein
MDLTDINHTLDTQAETDGVIRGISRDARQNANVMNKYTKH